MAGKALKAIALILMTAGAIATAAPGDTSRPSAAPAGPRPASPELICIDADVARTFGGAGAAGCREYMNACLGDLSAAQRAEWRRSVDACLSHEGSVYRCYAAEVPWC